MNFRVAFFGMLFADAGILFAREEVNRLLCVGVSLVCTVVVLFHIISDLTGPRS